MSEPSKTSSPNASEALLARVQRLRQQAEEFRRTVAEEARVLIDELRDTPG